MARQESLDHLRAKIDRIDSQILALLNRRGKLATEVGARKSVVGQAVYAPEREKRIFQRLLRENPGPLKPDSIEAIFREVISACLSLEKPLQVAFLGPEGTYSEEAARRQFGSRAHLVPFGSLGAVFDEVERGHADYGVVPVENSTAGVVAQTLDRFVISPLTIKAEVLLRIDHCLMARPDSPKRLRRIVSHPQSLGQCRAWLAEQYPQVPLQEVASNSAAAALAARHTGTAAIAGRQAAARYGLKILAAMIQDQPNNFTRFLVISPDAGGQPTGDDKTSVLFSVPHQPGALHRVLEPLARHGVNISTIESRPLTGRAWEYVFFLDLIGHAGEASMQKALATIEARSVFLKILGSYPAWRWPEEMARDGR